MSELSKSYSLFLFIADKTDYRCYWSYLKKCLIKGTNSFLLRIYICVAARYMIAPWISASVHIFYKYKYNYLLSTQLLSLVRACNYPVISKWELIAINISEAKSCATFAEYLDQWRIMATNVQWCVYACFVSKL